MAVVLAAALCGQAVSAADAATAAHRGAWANQTVLAVVTGNLPAAASHSAPARVYLLGEPDPGHPRVGQVFDEPMLASVKMTAGTSFRLAVPDTAVARSLLLPGSRTMNVRVMAVSSRGVTSWFAPARTGRPASAAAAPRVRAGRLPRFDLQALRRAAAPNGLTPAELVGGVAKKCIHDCVGCQWQDTKNKYNYTTRIGELHAASGVTAKYAYWTQADSTFTLGFEAAGESGWKADGTVGVTRDAGTGETDNESGYYSHYFEGKYDYAKYVQLAKPGDQCASAGSHKQNPTRWDGTIEPGNTVVGRRGSNCAGAIEYVTIQPGHSTAWKQKGKSIWWQTGVALPMGFSFGDRTGYSMNTKELWVDNNSSTSYLCGPNNDASVFDQWDVVYNYNSR
jgi:hypothetical protein